MHESKGLHESGELQNAVRDTPLPGTKSKYNQCLPTPPRRIQPIASKNAVREVGSPGGSTTERRMTEVFFQSYSLQSYSPRLSAPRAAFWAEAGCILRGVSANTGCISFLCLAGRGADFRHACRRAGGPARSVIRSWDYGVLVS